MISFDNFPVIYFGIGYLLAASLIALLLFRKAIPTIQLIFGLIATILIVWMRLPILVFNQEINADESQMIAHAITLWQYPIYWQSVDGTTIGPLDNYILLITKFFGLSFDYTAARIVGLGCVLGSLFFFYRSLKNFFNQSVAFVGILPPLFLLAFTQEGDFVHYSSEQLPLLLLNIALFHLSKLRITTEQLGLKSNPYFTLFLIGFVLGMSPFAKIQVVPLAAVIGLFAVVWNYKKQFLKNLLWLIVGGVSFPFLVVLWAFLYGVLDDLWNYYVLGNLIYASGGSLINAFMGIPKFFAKSPDFVLFIVAIALLILLFVLSPKKKNREIFAEKTRRNTLAFSVLWLLAALYAATKSGNDFVHYLNLCIYPLAFLGASLISQNSIYKNYLWPVAAIVALLPFGGTFLYKAIFHKPLNVYVSGTNHRVPLSKVSEAIVKIAKPTDRLVVWGWMCKYHVETQLAQGTAENHSERCIYDHPMRQLYFDRYVADLERNKPRFFVDAVGNSLWVNDRATQGHEAFPVLQQFVSNHYKLLTEVENTRIYLRK